MEEVKETVKEKKKIESKKKAKIKKEEDGIGEPLPEFIQFAIKIVGQGTNAAEPIRIRDLRVIALAT